tara:strand:+ start:261 stop:1049 length:789 start_codon:yes stop_codon:yes gene_type:complete
MKKKDIIKKIMTENFLNKNQSKYYFNINESKKEKESPIHKKKWERCVKDVKKQNKERGEDYNPYAVCTASIGYEGSIKKPHRRKESINPKMKKGELMEYVNSKKTMNENRGKKLHIVPELNRSEFSVIVGWLEKLRESGIINMFGAYPLLNWTKKDLHRWLYGQKMDIESLEEQKEALEYDIENEGEDGGLYQSELDSLEEKIEAINYLLDKKQTVRDVLIRAALKRIDRTNGDHETRNVQRVFEKLANEAWKMWTSVVYDW